MDIIEFKRTYQSVVVQEYPNSVNPQPKVSVCIQTFQHGKYIEQCLDSILSQEFGCDYEILIGEDNSSDGTREICIDYAQKYPGIIRLFLHERENNIQINGRPTGRFNFAYNLFSARGEYIALCEGDDYWIDDLKLQKQLDLLENTGYVACFTNGIVELTNGEKLNSYVKKIPESGIVSFDRIARDGGGLFPTASLFFRNCLKDYPEFFLEVMSGDRALSLLLANKGTFYFLADKTCVYRIHQGGLFSSILEDDSGRVNVYKSNIDLLERFNEFTNYKHKDMVSRAISLQVKKLMLKSDFKMNKNLFFKMNLKDMLSYTKYKILN